MNEKKSDITRLPDSTSDLDWSIESSELRNSLSLYFCCLFFLIYLYNNYAPSTTGYIKIFSSSVALACHNESVGQGNCLPHCNWQKMAPRWVSQCSILFTIVPSASFCAKWLLWPNFPHLIQPPVFKQDHSNGSV